MTNGTHKIDLDRLKQAMPIMDLAKSLGLEIRGRQARCYNSQAHAHNDRRPAFFMIPSIVHEKCNQNESMVYATVYWFHSLRDGKCTAGNEIIGQIARVSRVDNALTKLEKLGFIKRIFKDEHKKIRKQIIPLVDFGVSSTEDTVSSTEDTVSSTEDTKVSSTEEQKNNNIKKNNKGYSLQKSEKEIIDENSTIEKQIGEVIYLFRNLNPMYKVWFNRNPVRKKCQELLDIFGFVKVKNAILFAESIIDIEFAPEITTPAELGSKWGKLQAYYMKKKVSHQNKGKNYDE